MRSDVLESRRGLLYLTVFFVIFSAIIGAFYAWYGRHDINPDGISYLDIGDAFFRGDWKAAVTGYFSPLYSLILGFFMYVIKPLPSMEFTVIHIANFFCYLFALASFTFFLREFMVYRRDSTVSRHGKLASWPWVVLGYTLFIWSTLTLITITTVTPDICVSAFVYLIYGVLLRIRQRPSGYAGFFLLGLILGLAYLTKAVMFPLAFMFIGIALFICRGAKKPFLKFLISVVVFFLVSAPWFYAVSRSKSRLALADVGRIAYAMYINKINTYYWHGESPGSGVPKHPIRKIFDKPATYEFALPLKATCPLWYDSSYWNEGLKVHFDWKGQVRQLTENLKGYFHLFLSDYMLAGVLLFSIFMLYFVSYKGLVSFRDIFSPWMLILPGIMTMLLYALVHAEPRYVAPFIVVLYFGLLSGVRLPDTPELQKLFPAIACAVFLVNSYTYTPLKLIFPQTARVFLAGDVQLADNNRRYCLVVDELKNAGITANDKVAVIGDPFRAYWARLAKVKIIAATPLQDSIADFWGASDTQRGGVVESLRKNTAAKVIVASPAYSELENWEKIEGTEYSYCIIRR